VTPNGEDPAMESRREHAQHRAVPRPGARTAEWSTPRKLLASVGLLTAWAGLTGLGTFGTFTDPTTPLADGAESGRASLGLTATASLPSNGGDLLPGGSATARSTW
jgi:hypothetical protein